MSMLVI